MDEYYNSYAYPQVLYCFPYDDPCEDQGLESYEEAYYDPCDCLWEWPVNDWCQEPCEYWCQEPCYC